VEPRGNPLRKQNVVGNFIWTDLGMNKTLIPALTFLMVTGCAVKSKKDLLDNDALSLRYDTATTTIISWDKVHYPFDSTMYKSATLTQENMQQIDSLLLLCVTKRNNSLEPGHDGYKIDLKGKKYRRQLIAVLNSDGEKEVWVNCFCRVSVR
jgi:hypothetical protein